MALDQPTMDATAADQTVSVPVRLETPSLNLITMTTRRHDIQRAAVQLLNSNGMQGTTVAAVCAAADVTEDEFRQSFPSLEAVFGSIVSELADTKNAAVATTLASRRSLTESLQIAFLALWQLVEQHSEDHFAVSILADAELRNSGLPQPWAPSIHLTNVLMVERWLIDIEAIHHMTWQSPTRQLARLVVATFEGLVVDYFFTFDGAGIELLLKMFAFQLAQHGRRAGKNAMT